MKKATGPARQETKAIIGLGRATGLSRVPDASLVNSPDLIKQRLDGLLERSNRLESCELTALHIELSEAPSEASQIAVQEREAILAGFRQLTMAVTASSLEQVKRLAISVYEGAADASLLAGNLSFYLSCQSRLLSDLYPDDSVPTAAAAAERRDEFMTYSLLYFGVFCPSALELAVIMRRMTPRTLSLPSVKFAFAIVNAFANGNNVKFILLFNQCNVRQQTILKPSLQTVRKNALAEIVRAYLTLERKCAVSRLGLQSDSEFLRLLERERPDLMVKNSSNSPEFHFRRNGPS